MKRFLVLLICCVIAVGSVMPSIAAQHDYTIADASGAVVLSDMNNAFAAIATNNSGGTEPATIYADMWWFDTATNILKQRNEANTAWVNVAYKDGSDWTPYRLGALLTAVSTSAFSSQAQAEAGTDNATVMTPLRASQAITALQRGLASQAEAEAGTENTKTMTALRTSQAITALQRGLASQAQAEAGTDNSTDMTPLRVAQAITALVPPASASAGDVLQASSDVEKQQNNSAYTLTKAIQVPRAGTYRIKFDLKSSVAAVAYGRIYRNGVAVGTEQSQTNTYATKSEDIAGWSAGDSCQVYIAGSTASGYVKNFRIYESNGVDYVVTLD